MPQGKGLFATIGGYVRGMAGGMGGAAGRVGQAAYNMGQLGAFAARGGLGRTAQGAIIGGAAGGLYGAMSDDTSVLGGMIGGAGLGALGARYGGAGLRRANRGGGGMGFAAHAMYAGGAFGRGVMGQMRADFRGLRRGATSLMSNAKEAWASGVARAASAPAGATVAANAAVNPVPSSLKRSLAGLRGEELMGAITHNMNALRMRRNSPAARKRNMNRFFGPIG